MNYTLTLLDVGAIQDYIFGSNRLSHQLGASWLVEQAMGEWIDGALRGLKQGAIETGADAEIVYRGGGMACLLFKGEDVARSFVARHSRCVLLEAPGLTVVVQHVLASWDQPFTDVYTRALQKLAQRKAAAAPPLVDLGLAVTASCDYTGLPAVETDDLDRYASAMSAAKQRSDTAARSRMKRQFQEARGDYEFLNDFNEFGVEGSAYLAVVHADGNGIGRRKQGLVESLKAPGQNRELIAALRTFSEELNNAGTEALIETVRGLRTWLGGNDTADKHGNYRFIRRVRDTKTYALPFVPIVFGGDDVTFVCNGSLGISMAAQYLKAFRARTVVGQHVEACAGVAIVGSRFPFSRAYKMAEELCRNAKQKVKQDVKLMGGGSAVDWHYAVNGAVQDLGEIRAREYTTGSGNLTQRPLVIEGADAAQRLDGWSTFLGTVKKLRTTDTWKESRNKLKALRGYLRQGPPATGQFLSSIGKKLPEVHPNYPDAPMTGWAGEACAYLDAIEAMDRFENVEVP